MALSNALFGLIAETSIHAGSGRSTGVVAHVRLTESKTVADGALWYEETLPPETVMYVGINAYDARKPQGQADQTQFWSAKLILNAVTGAFQGERAYLQIGGNETVGMGWFRVSVLSAEGE